LFWGACGKRGTKKINGGLGVAQAVGYQPNTAFITRKRGKKRGDSEGKRKIQNNTFWQLWSLGPEKHPRSSAEGGNTAMPPTNKLPVLAYITNVHE